MFECVYCLKDDPFCQPEEVVLSHCIKVDPFQQPQPKDRLAYDAPKFLTSEALNQMMA